jgi:hypothetical protein
VSVHVLNCKSALVTEAERSMSSEALDFNNIEIQGKAPKEFTPF